MRTISLAALALFACAHEGGSKGTPAKTPTTDAERRAACEAGDGLSCVTVAVRSPAGPERSALFQRACDAGNQTGCAHVGAELYETAYFADDVTAAERAARLLETACDAGDPVGCAELADLYIEGWVKSQDPEMAIRLLIKGCDGGSANACNDLGYRYLYGDWIDYDQDASERYFHLAAELFERDCTAGSGEACYELAYALDSSEEYDRSVEPYDRACELGIDKACYQLAYLYAQGYLSVQDEAKSEAYQAKGDALLAARCDAGEVSACHELGSTILYYDATRAVPYLEKACVAENTNACYTLVAVYDGVYGGAPAPAAARELLETMCEGGDLTTCSLLGAHVLDVDRARALELFTRTCEASSSFATDCVRAADLSDSEHATPLLQKACDAGLDAGCARAGAARRDAGDLEGAYADFDKGCVAGGLESCFEAAIALETGAGVTKDAGAAFEHFEAACSWWGPKKGDACLAAARLLAATGDHATALRRYHEACSADPMTCAIAARGLLDGTVAAPAEASAIRIATSLAYGGCPAGPSSACAFTERLVSDRLLVDALAAKKPTKKKLSKTCAKKKTSGCLDLGLASQYGLLGAIDLVGARAAFTRLCDAGDAEGCLHAAFAAEVAGDTAESSTTLTKACEGGSDRACREAAVRDPCLVVSGAAPDSAACARLEELCGRGETHACADVVALFGVDAGTVALTGVEDGCAAGQPFACGMRAQVALAQDTDETAQGWMEKACATGGPWGCYWAASLVSDAAAARKLAEAGCEAGDFNSCNMVASDGGTESDHAEACAMGALWHCGSSLPATTGIASCDEFISKYMRCINEHVPEVARNQMKDAFQQTADMWREQAKDPDVTAALGEACTQMIESTKAATASFGCEW